MIRCLKVISLAMLLIIPTSSAWADSCTRAAVAGKARLDRSNATLSELNRRLDRAVKKTLADDAAYRRDENVKPVDQKKYMLTLLAAADSWRKTIGTLVQIIIEGQTAWKDREAIWIEILKACRR